MKYVIDHDCHIHSYLSPCAADPLQTKERILRYAKENNYKRVCVTDHFWDELVPYTAPAEKWSKWCEGNSFEHISEILPLPEDKDVKFMFGCETDMDLYHNIGVSRERMELFDFIIVATSHFHLRDFSLKDGATLEERALAWVDKFDALLDMDLPFHKVGVAHLSLGLWGKYKDGTPFNAWPLISDDTMKRLFSKAVDKGVGIELNLDIRGNEEFDTVETRPFRIAKECGCKFYLGSDVHTASGLDTYAYSKFQKIVDYLKLEESDKFIFRD